MWSQDHGPVLDTSLETENCSLGLEVYGLKWSCTLGLGNL